MLKTFKTYKIKMKGLLFLSRLGEVIHTSARQIMIYLHCSLLNLHFSVPLAQDITVGLNIQITGKQFGKYFSSDDVINMSWQQSCHWIKGNSVTAARHLENGTNIFIYDVIRSRSMMP